MDVTSNFDAQMQRIHLVTSTQTQAELAALLGIRQSFISDAKRRGKIPADWLLTLIRYLNINPEWILTGRGMRFWEAQADVYEDAQAAQEKKSALDALRSLPSRMLVEELLRRITVTEANRYCR